MHKEELMVSSEAVKSPTEAVRQLHGTGTKGAYMQAGELLA